MSDPFPSLATLADGYFNNTRRDEGYVVDGVDGDELAKLWRDACTVTTVEALDTLPVETVVRDVSGCVFEKSGDGEGDTPWWYDGNPETVADIELPALVIHHPSWAVAS